TALRDFDAAHVGLGSFTTDAVEATRSCMSAVARKRTNSGQSRYVRLVPCMDGSELARLFFTFAGWSVQPCVRPVSAAHRPLAIMPSADQVPVKSPHSTMHWHMWVVLIARSAGSALRAVRPPNLHIAPDL